MRRRLFALVAMLLWFAGCSSETALPGEGDDLFKIVVYRDTWGIPHIYAPSTQGGCYAMGWAQAEDRPEELLKNLLRGTGELSSVEGESGLESDLVSHLWNNYQFARENEDQLEDDLIACFRAFASGANAFYSQNPEDVPEWWGDRKVDEHMCIAFGRQFLYAWSIYQGFADLRRGGITPGMEGLGRSSNQFAVAPARSSEGAAILAIDPHLSWWGASRFWEFRIHAGKFRGSGVTLLGLPMLGLGHNENLAWAMTTGGPDTADVYELQLGEGSPPRYRYAGEWRDFESREVSIQVQGEPDPRKIQILESHHGPVAAVRGDKAYAIRMAYADQVGAVQAFNDLARGEDYQAVLRAVERGSLFPQNVMAADTSGNIFYIRAGRVPRRPEGYDWSRPVDGSTPKTEWNGFYAVSDLVQILNPEQGYMQNCNIPPDAMMVGSPLTPDKYPDSLYGDSSYGPLGGWNNARGARAVELLQNDDRVSAEDAIACILDIKPYGVERWLELLKKAADSDGKVDRSELFNRGIEELLGWDGLLRKDSSAALKYVYWRQQLAQIYGPDYQTLMSRVDNFQAPLGADKPPVELTDAEAGRLLEAFQSGLETLRSELGKDEATWGDAFRVGRNEMSWPAEGGQSSSLGVSTLRNVGYGDLRPDGTRWGQHGQTSTQVVVLSKPIRSWTALPVGQSDREDSPHFRDQAERLFSPRRLKESWWLPEELAPNVRSRTVLEKVR